MDDLLREFLVETNENLDTVDVQLVKLERDPNNADILANIFRLVHTIKGTCGFVGLPRLEALAHAAETLMARFREGAPVTADAVTLILATIDRIKEILVGLEAEQCEPRGGDPDLIVQLERMATSSQPASGGAPPSSETAASATAIADNGPGAADGETEPESPAAPASGAQTLRVSVDTLERLMTVVSELVLTRNQLLEVARSDENSALSESLQRLSTVTSELQEGVMQTRMQPIGAAWQKLPRIVRDLAVDLGKEIDLQMVGGETELDRQVLDLIRDPLTHLVRNAADHGLERPAERQALGKSAKGLIRLSASHEGGRIIVELADDGRGLNTQRILAKGVAAGLVTAGEAERMSEASIHKLIFSPGFSTLSGVTSVSGRGVGLDVVRSNLDQIGGSVEVKSVAGAGVVFSLKIPLTLAILPSLIVVVGASRYAIPQMAVREVVSLEAGEGATADYVEGADLIRLRDKLLPLVYLAELFGAPAAENARGGTLALVIQASGRRYGLVVDAVVQTEEIVVKPLASRLRHLRAFSGNTILGDGGVVMIIDPNGVGEMVGVSSISTDADVASTTSPHHAATAPTSLLLFRAGTPHLKAVPLALVTRLEEVPHQHIEQADGRELLQYHGRLVPLVRLAPLTSKRKHQSLLVFSHAGRTMALAVDEIVDIVDNVLSIDLPSEHPSLIGSAIVADQAVEIIDVGHFLPETLGRWFHRGMSDGPVDGLRVLFVDDAAFFRSMLPPFLQAVGCVVTTAESAEQALTMIDDGRGFEIIVSDLEMPGMDGFAFAKALRNNPRTAAIPLIALSSHATSRLVDRVKAAGFSTFVAKFDREGLIAALRSAGAQLNKVAA